MFRMCRFLVHSMHLSEDVKDIQIWIYWGGGVGGGGSFGGATLKSG